MCTCAHDACTKDDDVEQLKKLARDVLWTRISLIGFAMIGALELHNPLLASHMSPALAKAMQGDPVLTILTFMIGGPVLVLAITLAAFGIAWLFVAVPIHCAIAAARAARTFLHERKSS